MSLETLAHQLSEGWEARLTVIADGILPLESALTALKRWPKSASRLVFS